MRQIGLVIVFAFLSSLTIQVGIAIAYGLPKVPWPIEVLSHPRVSFAEEARRAIFYTPGLSKSDQPTLIVAGASSAQEGFQPRIMQTVVPHLLTHNLAMGGANISEVDQIIDHALKSELRTDILSNSLLVLAVSYAMFVPDEKRWRDPIFVPPAAIIQEQVQTDVEREALRCPNACDRDSAFYKMAPRWMVSLAKLRYVLFLPVVQHLPPHPGDPILENSIWKQDLLNLIEPPSSVSSAEKEPSPNSESYLVKAHRQMDFLTEYMGKPEGVLHSEQFEKLNELIKKIRGHGMRVAVVDMPLPSWHREKSPFFVPYREKLSASLALHTEDKGVVLVDMASAIPDDEFRDSVHPKAEAAEHWAKVLVESLF